MDFIPGNTMASFWQAANGVDAIVVVVTLVSAALGLWTGFVWQIIRIISWLAAFWMAGRYSRPLSEQLGEHFTGNVRILLSWLAIFVVVLMVFYIIGYLGRAAVDALNVELGDRILGAFFGAAKGLLICGSLSLVVLVYISPDTALHAAVKDSVLGSRCAGVVAMLWLVLPGQGGP